MDGPEHADRRLLRRPLQPRGDVVAHVEEQVEILLAPVPVLDAVQHPLQPAGSLPAGGALAARLPREELGDPPGRPDHAGRRVHDRDRPRAEHRAGLGHLVLTEGEVELVGAEPRGRDPPGDDRLDLAAAGDAAAQHRRVDQVPEGGLHHLHLVGPRVSHVAREGEEPRAGRAPTAQGGEGRPAVGHDPRQVGHRLDVVHHRRLTVEADDGREVRRLDAGEAALALERLEQGRLLAADVGAGARVDHDVEGEARAEDVGAHRPVGVGLVEGRPAPARGRGRTRPGGRRRPGRPAARRRRSPRPRAAGGGRARPGGGP